jgi:RNA polymerase sigma factor (TIGR02999 family)
MQTTLIDLSFGQGAPAPHTGVHCRRMTAEASPPPITCLLRDWGEGRPGADEALLSRVYDELRRLARGRLRHERSDHTLQPTALVHEAWARLVGHEQLDWHSRAHFFGIAARLMRQILIDHARARAAARRQGGLRIELTEQPGDGAGGEPLLEVLAVHEALERLAAFDDRRARVLELRFFAGLDRKEIAEVLDITERTVKRDLVVAQAWLRRELAHQAPPGDDGT